MCTGKRQTHIRNAPSSRTAVTGIGLYGHAGSEMGKGQADTVFVFDEPTIGLHPLDVRTLLGVFQRLIDSGATVVVIEHDLDVIRNADYLVDLGPGGGESGGRIVACGTPEQVAADPASITGKYLHL